MPFEVKPSRPGPFEADLSIFVDDGRLHVQPVSVRGNAITDAAGPN
jgi:hypothetical protein